MILAIGVNSKIVTIFNKILEEETMKGNLKPNQCHQKNRQTKKRNISGCNAAEKYI